MRLKSRLLSHLLTAWAASVVLLGVVLLLMVRQQLIQGATTNLQRTVHLLQRDVVHFLAEREGDLAVIAAAPETQAEDVRAATAALARLRDAYGVYESLSLVDASGVVRAHTNQLGLGEVMPGWEAMVSADRGLQFLAQASQARGSARMWQRVSAARGWVVATIPLERLHDLLVAPELQLQGMEVRLTAADGLVLFDFQAPQHVGQSVTIPDDHQFVVWNTSDARVLQCGVAQRGHRGQQGWDLIISQPMGHVLAGLRSLVVAILVMLAIALVIGGVLIYQVSEALARPLRELAETVVVLETESSARQRALHPVSMPANASEEVVTLHTSLDYMARRLGQRLQQLVLAEERLSLALATTNTGLWDWEFPTEILTFSPTWSALLGYEPHEVAGTWEAWSRLIHPDDVAGVQAALEQHRDGRCAVYRHEHRMRAKDERWMWVLDTGRVVARDPAGMPVRMVGTLIDITTMKETQQRLVEARQEAEAAVRAKADFLATMSHEIRTPMNGVIGMTGVLLGMSLDEPQRDAVETIQRSGQALLTVLNDILDFSKIEAGRLELRPAAFAPRQAIDDVVTLFQAQAVAKGLTLAVQYPDDLPPVLIADPNRVRQVVLNLVSNAIKFTDHGGVAVVARRVTGEGAEHGWLDIAVRDTGIGIAPEDQARLFQRFSQIDTGDTRRFGGTGLGLAISRYLAEAMGGSIRLDSARGQGSTFTVRWPLPDPARRVTDRFQREVTTSTMVLPRVLLVEDNMVNQKVAVLMLRSLGVEVQVTSDGLEGVAAWQADRQRLVLMDCQMPGMDGFAATRAIRQAEEDGGLTRTPIIALTAGVMDEDRRRCLEVGMDAVLPKPLERDELEQALRRWGAPAPSR